MAELTLKQQEAMDAYNKYGSERAAADALGVTRNAVRDRMKGAKLKLSEGAMRAVENAGLSVAEAKGGWIHNYDDEGRKIGTTRWAPEDDAPEDVLERIRAAFDGLMPAPPIAPPAQVMDDLLTLYPLMDAHLGMHSWGRETGLDYDLKLAVEDMRRAFAKVAARSPASHTAVLLVGGDYFHADDSQAETPTSKHKLDVDGRHFKVLEDGVAILAEVADGLRAKHSALIVRVLRGNHDPHSHMVLTFALAERYKDDSRVTIQRNPRDLFMHQWGESAIFAHHGDRGKPEQMALYLSDICPFWSATKHRHYFAGHKHRDEVLDLGSVRIERLRAFCPPDAYAAGMGYGGRRNLQSVTFDKRDGLVARALDPILRDA